MINYFLIILIFSISCVKTGAQNIQQADPIYSIFDVDSLPDYPGGSAKLNEYISSELSKRSFETCPGVVMINFIVEKDGSLSNFRFIRKVCPSADETVMEIMKKMPKWEVGYKNGQVVRVSVNVPVKLQNSVNINTQ